MSGLDVLKIQLEGVVGSENVLSDPETLERFSKDQSFVPPRKPLFVVRPKNPEEVQDIIRIARYSKIPVTPFSCGKDGQGAFISKFPGILLDLSTMNKIRGIDPAKRIAVVEPGVTFAQLQKEAGKTRSEEFPLGLRVLTPVELPASATVLSTYLELFPLYSWAKYGPIIVQSMDIVLGTGEYLCTAGEAPYSLPYTGSGSLFRYVWFGAQGSLGVALSGVVLLKTVYEINEVLFIPLERAEDAYPLIREIRYQDTGEEVFLMNAMDMALRLMNSSAELKDLVNALPPWTLVHVLRGEPGLVEYQKADLKDAFSRMGVKLETTIPGVEKAEEKILNEILMPSGFEKFATYKGVRNTIQFIIPFSEIKRIYLYDKIVEQIADKYGYPSSEIGKTLVPCFTGAGVHYQYAFHRKPEDCEEGDKVRRIFYEASEKLMDLGAVFRPYGMLAKMCKIRVGTGRIALLEKMKKVVDPDNILSPGKLLHEI